MRHFSHGCFYILDIPSGHTLHSLAGLLEHGEVLHHGEQLGLGLLRLLRHVVQQVHAWLVGPGKYFSLLIQIIFALFT